MSRLCQLAAASALATATPAIGARDAFGKEQLNAPDEDHLDLQQLFALRF